MPVLGEEVDQEALVGRLGIAVSGAVDAQPGDPGGCLRRREGDHLARAAEALLAVGLAVPVLQDGGRRLDGRRVRVGRGGRVPAFLRRRGGMGLARRRSFGSRRRQRPGGSGRDDARRQDRARDQSPRDHPQLVQPHGLQDLLGERGRGGDRSEDRQPPGRGCQHGPRRRIRQRGRHDRPRHLRPEHRAGQDRRGGDAPADQPIPEPFAAPRQPALQRAEGPAQLSRGLLPRQALQEAEHDRGAVPPRQPVDLLVDERAEVVGTGVAGRRVGQLGGPALVPTPTGLGRPGAPGDPAGDLMQPGGQGVPHPQRAGPARQDEERGLEGVLRRVLVAEDRSAGAGRPGRAARPGPRRRPRPPPRPGRGSRPAIARPSARRSSPP